MSIYHRFLLLAAFVLTTSPFSAVSLSSDGVSGSFPEPVLNQRVPRGSPITFPIHHGSGRISRNKAHTVADPIRTLARDRDRVYNLLSQPRKHLDVKPRSEDGVQHGRRTSRQTMGINSFDVDISYYTTIQVGTPAQSIDVILDTGSLDLWIQEAGCTQCSNAGVEPMYDGTLAGFNSSLSSTFSTSSSSTVLPYFDGSAVSGQVVNDTVKLGKFLVGDQYFVLANRTDGDWGISGLLGLSWPKWDDATAYDDIWWLRVLSQLDQPEMSFFLTEWRGHEEAIMPGGQFTLGGRNASLYDGEIAFVPILGNGFWDVAVSALTRRGGGSPKTVLLNATVNVVAAVDTGTTALLGPSHVIDSFFKGAPGAIRGEALHPQLNNTWLLPCNTTLTAQFHFAWNVVVTVPATNMILRGQNTTQLPPGYCVSSLQASGNVENFYNTPSNTTQNATNSDPAWWLGGSFLKSTYTVFRARDITRNFGGPGVGFAPLKGVNYSADANAIIGVNGDGVDGNIGGANVTIPNAATSAAVMRPLVVWVFETIVFWLLSW